MGYRYKGTCCPIVTHPTDDTYKIVIGVILQCIFMLAFACAIYWLRDTKKTTKLCGLQKNDKSNKSIGETNGGLEHDEPRVDQVSENCDEITC